MSERYEIHHIPGVGWNLFDTETKKAKFQYRFFANAEKEANRLNKLEKENNAE